MEQKLTSLVARLEAVTTRLESTATKSSGGAGGESDELVPFVVAFDDLVNGSFKNYLDASNKIGGDVQTQAQIVNDAFKAQRNFLIIASKSKAPAQDVLMKLLDPTSQKLKNIEEFVSKNRRSDFFNHLSGVGSSVPALGWVAVSPTPGPFVRDMADSGQFYLNRVLKDFKEKDKTHVDWTRAWTATLTQLQAYIKQYHTTGLSWNPKGGDASSCAAPAATKAAPPPPAAGGPPPPPPPPGPLPPGLLDDVKKPQAGEDSARGALFADISKGTDVTKGLKKVTDSMKTHKNPNLKLQTPQPYRPVPSPKPTPSKFEVMKKLQSVKPPKCVLENKKWVVEYQIGNKNLSITDTNNRQTVYIFKCENSTIQIKGKINSIVMDSCKKTGLVFDDVISSMDFINCQGVQAQVTGKVNTVSIDKTDGCMMYLSKESVHAEIVTAKSSEMNILVEDNSGEYKEFALPEQFKSIWNGKRFVTETTDVIS